MINIPATSLEFASTRAGAFAETHAHDRLRLQRAAIWRDTGTNFRFDKYMEDQGFTRVWDQRTPNLPATHSSYFFGTWVIVPLKDLYPNYVPTPPVTPGFPTGPRAFRWTGELAYRNRFFASDVRALFPVTRDWHFIHGKLEASFQAGLGYTGLANTHVPNNVVSGGSNGTFNFWPSSYAGSTGAAVEWILFAAEGVTPTVEIADPGGFIARTDVWQDDYQISAQSIPGFWMYTGVDLEGGGVELFADDLIPSGPLPEVRWSMVADPSHNVGIFENRYPGKLWRVSVHPREPLLNNFFDLRLTATSPGTVVLGGRTMLETLLAQPIVISSQQSV